MNSSIPATRPAAASHDFLAPVFAQYPIEVVSAQGVWLTNSRGERVLDLYGGHAVAALGYGHAGFTRALTNQAQSCNFKSNAVAMQVRTRAAERLVRFSKLPITSVFFVKQRRGSQRERAQARIPDDFAPAGCRRRWQLPRPHGRGRRRDLGCSAKMVQLSAHAVRSQFSFRAVMSTRSPDSSLTGPPL